MSNVVQAIIKAADQCVMCGLCLPHCPTYGLRKDEGDSPRGRVALARGLASGQLAPSATLVGHLDRCLTCRACETACPAGVRYGEIIDYTRAHMAHQQPRRRWLNWVAPRPWALGTLAWLARVYQKLPLRLDRWLTRTPLGRPLSVLPRVERSLAFKPLYPARGERQGRVALFVGCMSGAFDAVTLHDGIRVLTAMGFEVTIPPTQTCCGALHQHSGDLDTAQRLLAQNQSAFSQETYDAKLVVASGCGAQLLEHDHTPGTVPWQEITDFVHAHRNRLPLAVPTKAPRIAVHTPCTHRNVMKSAAKVEALLKDIFGDAVYPLPSNAVCCGAAGQNMLTQPATADALRTKKMADVRALDPSLVVSSNIGCAWHLAAGLRAERARIDVIHPIRLIARYLHSDSTHAPTTL